MSKELTKIVVRLLPPEITEDELANSIGEVHLQHATWRRFTPGKRYKGEAKPSRNARSYYNFDTAEHAEAFIKDYHGHQFVDGHGEAFRAVVCYAPCQKVPRSKVMKDRHEGTILESEAYLAFVESLGQPKVFVAPSNEKEDLRPANPGETPLLEHLREKQRERKARQERREWKKWEKSQSYEEPKGKKKARWHCSECGTSRNLEEDPDDRGTFYCTPCWESWESAEAPPKPSKSKKKNKAAAQEAEKEKRKDEAEDYGEEPKKKSKKKKAAAEAETQQESKEWWGDSNWSYSGYGESSTTTSDSKKGKSKKKDKEAASGYDAGSYWSSSSSRYDKGGDSWWEEGYGHSKESYSSSRGGRSEDKDSKWRGSRRYGS